VGDENEKREDREDRVMEKIAWFIQAFYFLTLILVVYFVYQTYQAYEFIKQNMQHGECYRMLNNTYDRCIVYESEVRMYR